MWHTNTSHFVNKINVLLKKCKTIFLFFFAFDIVAVLVFVTVDAVVVVAVNDVLVFTVDMMML